VYANEAIAEYLHGEVTTMQGIAIIILWLGLYVVIMHMAQMT
jgi:hypothetical protein